MEIIKLLFLKLHHYQNYSNEPLCALFVLALLTPLLLSLWPGKQLLVRVVIELLMHQTPVLGLAGLLLWLFLLRPRLGSILAWQPAAPGTETKSSCWAPWAFWRATGKKPHSPPLHPQTPKPQSRAHCSSGARPCTPCLLVAPPRS